MAEDRSRFRIKRGDTEIEFEGKTAEVQEKYKEAFDFINKIPAVVAQPQVEKKDTVIKEDKRGGARSNVVSKAIDTLIQEHWIKSKKAQDIITELQRRAVPGAAEITVYNALNRRVNKALDRIKDRDGQWIYTEKV